MIQIDDMLQRLNRYQRQAVLDESPAALVNANVGSGKTTVLISKVFYQHMVLQVPLKEMVVLTFTNKAANEIRERMIAADPQVKEEDMPWFGTFHSVAMRMLQTVLPVETLRYTKSFTVLDPDELNEMAERLITEHGFKIKYRSKLSKRLEAFAAGQLLYGVMKQADDIAKLWDCIIGEKVAQNKMDFDDLIRNAAQLLNCCDFAPKWVIVDEFQDCDSLQLEFIRATMSAGTKLFAVGDPNQIIYSWRGSSKNIFTGFIREVSARELSLPLNYRSSNTILEAAKCFLENRSDLEGIREPGCGIIVRKHYSPFMEADYLADKIRQLHNTGVDYHDIAVFYRLQRQSGTIADVFRHAGIPFEISARKTLKDIPVLQWLVRLLSASVNKNDRNGIISVLTNKQFGPGLTLAQARRLTESDGSPLSDKIRGFTQWAVKSGTVHEIYDYFDLDVYLSPTSVTFQENRAYVLGLLERLEEYIAKRKCALVPGLADFLNLAALYGTEILLDGDPVYEDTVKLMTLHACKGLEFQYVFIIGVNYGLIPLRADPGKEQNCDEEEKRLFFVGITRAKDYLELSYYTSPDDPRIAPGASSYLSVIPRRLLDYEEESRSGETDLQSFRRMIMKNRDRDRIKDPFSSLNETVQKEKDTPPVVSAERKVRHAKYGEGVIESENENTVTVDFPEYGSKSFSKDFCPLEYL